MKEIIKVVGVIFDKVNSEVGVVTVLSLLVVALALWVVREAIKSSNRRSNKE